MSDISSPKYDKLRNWIRLAIENGLSWEAIKYANQSDENSLKVELKRKVDNEFWPMDTTIELWLDVVNNEEEAERYRKEVIIRQDKAMLTDKSEDGDISAPTDNYSSWALYKKYLIDSKWNEESIKEIESATIHILRRLKVDTKGFKAVKGLVVGHVQSGKTANMAALMAMAADWGWNMFIVLSGTIDSLRRQTQSRLFNDLNRPGNIDWTGLEHLSLQSSMGQRLQDLNFSGNNKKRYFTVCLKNSTRLANLIKWMQADNNKLEQLKIIVIDDEADQGGVNTAKISNDERSKINNLIVNLVEGKTYKGEDLTAGPLAMNYIGYTATPYANFLNESHPKSLYPSSFIRTLQPAEEYFGAKQIYGIEGIEDCDGIDILRRIDNNSLNSLKQIHDGNETDLPDAAINSLVWYLCASSAMRLNGYEKPISMLVHTSQRQGHHSRVAQAVEIWLKQKNKQSILSKCKEIWDFETNQFDINSFREQFPNYPNAEYIVDYPSFNEIQEGIIELVSEISHITMSDDNQLIYHSGIHLCIDNCANNSLNENMFVRLSYPDPTQLNYPKPAPAFIVIGGSTLSRGLTIEGLVSTFFLRSSNQADTLMQMGRWFGYRKKYELYPRIWMTEATENKFRYLAQLEYELRDDLKRYAVSGVDPSEFGPRVKSIPSVLKLKITAANRMQSAIVAEMDFSGTNAQTVVFSEDVGILNHNIDTANEFLKSLGQGVSSQSENSMIWRGVSFNNIKEGLLLNKMKFHHRATVFNQIEAFCEWFDESAEEAGYSKWNVIVAGNKRTDTSDEVWEVPGGGVNIIGRSRRTNSNHDNSVSVGVLRDPKDLYEDILDFDEIEEKKKSSDINAIMDARKNAGLQNTPLLILYRINKNSKAQIKKNGTGNKLRTDLSIDADIIGLSMWIPGVKSKSLIKSITVRIDNQDDDIDDETGDGNYED